MAFLMRHVNFIKHVAEESQGKQLLLCRAQRLFGFFSDGLSLLLSISHPLHLVALLWIKAGQGASHHSAQCQTEHADVSRCQSSSRKQGSEGKLSRLRAGHNHPI